MDLFSKLLHSSTGPLRVYSLPVHLRVLTRITGRDHTCLVQVHPSNQTVLYQFSCSFRSDVPQPTVEFHDGNRLLGTSGILIPLFVIHTIHAVAHRHLGDDPVTWAEYLCIVGEE